ncbi:glycosyl hydrolase [Lipomyces tetrasporus]|uniref:Glycosyl hydrolase n=1 Tax=Lipomyces tetrasporus TaxID=54092 RepID=A0AAD7VUF9_9ASCO|nr:glycosyl hydrolase [Lipomyces tetrasporus]KAJ8103102.1 glycosyl hydrolase [Lipomyces tetrasporus]
MALVGYPTYDGPSSKVLPPTPPLITDEVSAFMKWRPQFHLLASHGWMNDPCAVSYDPEERVYRVFYQWNPQSPFWDHICWGGAQSANLLDWTVSSDPVLSPEASYDGKGIFTGCTLPPSSGKQITIFYTSVSRLPIHYSLPYHIGSETLSMATSTDGGRTWARSKANPILGPEHLADFNITGWRDPFVTKWASMDKVMGRKEAGLYGLISGGIRDTTPSCFLYDINPSDPTLWKFVGPLMKLECNYRPSRWSGDSGVNWEVANVLTYDQYDFLLISSEGGAVKRNGKQTRASIWIAGSLQETTPVTMKYDFGGLFDHGDYYASNTFRDESLDNAIVAWGWIIEDALSDELIARQNWSGSMSVPRVISVAVVNNVIGALHSPIDQLTNFKVVKSEDSYELTTLGVDVHPRYVSSLRERAVHHIVVPAVTFFRPGVVDCGVSSTSWELETEISVSSSPVQVGILALHSANYSEQTRLVFSTDRETFTIDRSRSGNGKELHAYDAPHTLFTSRTSYGAEVVEKLKLHVLCDKSVIEVFLNGRTAVSARVYPDEASSRISLFAENLTGEAVEFSETKLWYGITGKSSIE